MHRSLVSAYFRDFARPAGISNRNRRVDEARARRAAVSKATRKFSPWMQLQWLRYVSICRPVERHQFIIIALNRPAPYAATPYHSILPSIVQFRFYAPVGSRPIAFAFSHSTFLPLALSFSTWISHSSLDAVYYIKASTSRVASQTKRSSNFHPQPFASFRVAFREKENFFLRMLLDGEGW